MNYMFRKIGFLLVSLVASVGNLLSQENISHGYLAEQRATPSPRFAADVVEVSVKSAQLFSIFNDNNYYVPAEQLAVHWQLDDVTLDDWRRGNTEWVMGAYYYPTVNGVESRFAGGFWGPRYNFVQEGWDWVPYVEAQVGFGFTDSRALKGSQGQDYVFTFGVGLGTRYLIDDHWTLDLGAWYQHFSNGGLSEPGVKNNGLDLVGPRVGIGYAF